MSNPTCDQCDCVAGCQANPVVCPNVAQPVFHLRQYGDVTATQLDAAVAQSEQSKQELGAIYQYQMADGSWIDQIKDSYKHNLRYGNAIVRILYPTPQPAIAQPEQTAPSGELTNDEIIRIAKRTKTADPGRDGYILPISFARAVIAAIAQPQQHTPLTEIDLCLLLVDIYPITKRLPPEFKAFARAIEAAHNIAQPKDKP